MFWSKTFIPTLKETPQDSEALSCQLLLRAGFIRMIIAGVYTYLPLGLKVLNNVERIIREEMDIAGGVELLLPALQPLELWQKSGRDKEIGEVMTRFVDRRGRKVCLGPTHEEVITDLVKSHILSYRQLPLILYQIQTKFRDEIRPRFGLVRACEFVMKDAYSFDRDSASLDAHYQAMLCAYKRIFKRCGLKILTIEADPGMMGGSASHEFMVCGKDGEDLILLCPGCNFAQAFKEDLKDTCPKCNLKLEKINCIEVGHIFKLGTKYSLALGANFLSAQGELRPIVMGCYGIGVSRLIPAIIEQNHDSEGIIWPDEITPYQVTILPLDTNDKKIMKLALGVYKELKEDGIEAFLDDRDERAGVKFKDADLLGIPLQVIISHKHVEEDTLELKRRRNQKRVVGDRRAILQEIKERVNG